jgi:beta-glucuronidase
MLRTLVHDLKNHPSVVIWSVGNECATDKPESRPLIKHLADTVRSLDTSRPVAMVGMYGERDLFFDLVDLPCMNTYSFHDQAGLRSKIEKILAKIGDKPLLVTEFGAEAMRELHGDNYGTEEEQASILTDHWQVFQEYRQSIPGALIWSLADYWHMPMGPDFSWGVNRFYFCHGLLSLDRFPKKATETVIKLFESMKG